MPNHRILVPFDFTPVSEVSIEHAFVVGKAIDSEIILLHVVGNKSDFPEARERMEALLERCKGKYPHTIRYTIRIGSIFEEIDDASVEEMANLIIMGTHGMRGMQFITGGRALKIVTNCSVPVIITQEKGIREHGYNDIVVPLDLHQDTKQKLNIVAEMATYFKGRVHLISPGEDDEFLRNQLNRNINYAKEFFDEQGIEHTATISEHSSGAFVKDVIRFASSLDADLISIMNLHEKSLMGILGQTYEQQVITNEAEIPVLILNPKETRVIRNSVFARN
jgi:nucleotide-binding universal stress UspA family protein